MDSEVPLVCRVWINIQSYADACFQSKLDRVAADISGSVISPLCQKGSRIF